MIFKATFVKIFFLQKNTHLLIVLEAYVWKKREVSWENLETNSAWSLVQLTVSHYSNFEHHNNKHVPKCFKS
jgi:hypothetical protein